MDLKKTLFTPFYKAAKLKAFVLSQSEGRAQPQMCIEDTNTIHLNQTDLGGFQRLSMFFFFL